MQKTYIINFHNFSIFAKNINKFEATNIMKYKLTYKLNKIIVYLIKNKYECYHT